MRTSQIPLESPPCPICGGTITLFQYWREEIVGNAASEHFYECSILNPNLTPSEIHTSLAKLEPWVAECFAVVEQARAVENQTLTPEQLQAAQSRGGKNQSVEHKRSGGKNQSVEDKSRGGMLAMHRRWHESKGVKKSGCSLCYPDQIIPT